MSEVTLCFPPFLATHLSQKNVSRRARKRRKRAVWICLIGEWREELGGEGEVAEKGKEDEAGENEKEAI